MSVDSPNFEGLDRWAFASRRVEKPWGFELIWAEAEDYVGKILLVRAGHRNTEGTLVVTYLVGYVPLFVRAGHSLSLQFHREKDESWYVQSGRAELELGDAGERLLNTEVITAGACFRFRPGTVHRVTALDDTTILEVSTPHLDDVVRLEDAYGRAGTADP